MTRMLASVTGVEEAEIVLAGGVDIVDLKDAKAGALGAVAIDVMRRTVSSIAGRTPVSAVCGDLPMEPETIRAKAEEIAATGVDYLKIGFFPSPEAAACAKALSPLAGKTKLIAVLFADLAPDFDLLTVFAANGFHGAMVDTADKRRGRLLDHLPPENIPDFVDRCKSLGLMVGLERIARSSRHSAAAAFRARFPRLSRRTMRPVGAHRLDQRGSDRANPRSDPRGAESRRLVKRRLPSAGGARLFARRHRSDAWDGQDLRAGFRAAGPDRRLQFRARPYPEGAFRRDRRCAADHRPSRRHAPCVFLRHHHGWHPHHRRAGHVQLSEALAEHVAAHVLEDPRVMRVDGQGGKARARPRRRRRRDRTQAGQAASVGNTSQSIAEAEATVPGHGKKGLTS